MKHRQGRAEVYEKTVHIPTYGTGRPDKNPMFLEKRVYQGSSGKVYPYPVIDKIYDEKKDKAYKAVFLENDWLLVMVLPELGGRVQRLYDKTNHYDAVYYNEVIKPALVGLTGPWISGGIEFNWPQHHRPTTFSPTDYTIQENKDGSCSVLLSEVDQMYGTKEVTTLTVYPDKAYLEIKGRLYNRTCLPQTFLWWANPAVAVNDNTQSIFPPDVHAVFDHGKRDVSKFPIATGVYYKYDYGRGVDISRYKNIPVPTSYMCYHSDYNFVGNYDYGKKAGLLHVADHHISPGKKQWTWGCGDFGHAWDRNLTDANGPYIELMTGVFTDNQPDFTWLKPFEEKTFTQYFMPYKGVGAVKNASTEVVLNLEKKGHKAAVAVYACAVYNKARVVLSSPGKKLLDAVVNLSPARVYEKQVETDCREEELTLAVYDQTGRQMLSYTPAPKTIEKTPDPAKPAKDPAEIMTVEELVLTGQHIEQYRHATYDPDPYYLEALKRDPGDIRANIAYGVLLLRRTQFAESEKYFRRAIARLTALNPNPYDSEAYFDLGLSLWYQKRMDEAYDAFYKATWSMEQQEAGFYYLACIDCRRNDYGFALEHIEQSLVRNSHNIRARALKGLILEKLGQTEEADAWFTANVKLDPFDYVSQLSLVRLGEKTKEEVKALMGKRISSFIEAAIDLSAAGFTELAAETLSLGPKGSPMLDYYLAAVLENTSPKKAARYGEKAAADDPYCCFPNRLEDVAVLEAAMRRNPQDGMAPYYLGCLLYAKKQYEKALTLFEKSAKLKPEFPTVFRNLSIGYFNVRRDKKAALKMMEKAYALDESDARIFLELDQLYQKVGKSVRFRRAKFEAHADIWPQRDDLYIEYVTLLNLEGEYAKAYDLIMQHKFHPWEGGEGKITHQYVVCLEQMARQALQKGQAAKAVELLEKALVYPENLGEGKLIIARDNDLHFYLGLARRMLGQEEEAVREFTLAAQGDEEPAGMMYYNDMPADLILYEGLASRALGNEDHAMARFHKLLDYGEQHYYDKVRIEYFAVSLPDLHLFDEDLTMRSRAHCAYLIALGSYGMGDDETAAKFYAETLAIDHAHQGAILHQKLLREHPDARNWKKGE
jgi:tetratricopeptide (TPR) repeat protein